MAGNEACRILSIASGHCRELQGSLVSRSDFQGEFIAVGQDAQACDYVRSEYAAHTIQVEVANVSSLLMPTADLGRFNLIYSAGLLDYLTAPFARKLVAALIRRLEPRGKLLITNFLPQSDGRGYMETMMDWHLVYRSESELMSLFGHAPAVKPRSFVDPHGNVAYAEYQRGD
ncbi:MAG: extracellular factor (EF) 3-hydroxypalmitic acid methyl ester biosynthesis protein [Gammaproteobacteria bacterium]